MQKTSTTKPFLRYPQQSPLPPTSPPSIIPSSHNSPPQKSEQYEISIQTNSFYPYAQSYLQDQNNLDTLETKVPVFLLTFPAPNAATANAFRDNALKNLNTKLAALEKPTTWEDWKGIQCVDFQHENSEKIVPGIEIHYHFDLGELLRHHLGFTPCKQSQNNVDPEFAKHVNPVCAEFERLWIEQTRHISCEPDDFGYSIYQPTATHLDYCNAVSELLKGNFLIGEPYDCRSARNFIIQNMPFLREQGFTWFFLGTLPNDAQALVDAYLSSAQDAPMPPQLELLADTLGLKEILQAAKEAGMQVFGVNSVFTFRSIFTQKSFANWDKTRCAALNQFFIENYIANISPKIKEINGKGFGLIDKNNVMLSDDKVPGILTILKGWKSACIFDLDFDTESISPYILVSHDKKSSIPNKPYSYIDPWRNDIRNATSHLYICARNPNKMSLTDENNVASFQVIPKNRGQWRHKTPLFTIPPENPINSGIKGDEDAPAVNDGKIVKQKPMELSQLRIENGRLKHEINSDIEILKNVLTKRLEMEAASMARMATPEQMESLQLHNENALLKRKANALKKLMDNVNKYSKNVT